MYKPINLLRRQHLKVVFLVVVSDAVVVGISIAEMMLAIDIRPSEK